MGEKIFANENEKNLPAEIAQNLETLSLEIETENLAEKNKKLILQIEPRVLADYFLPESPEIFYGEIFPIVMAAAESSEEINIIDYLQNEKSSPPDYFLHVPTEIFFIYFDISREPRIFKNFIQKKNISARKFFLEIWPQQIAKNFRYHSFAEKKKMQKIMIQKDFAGAMAIFPQIKNFVGIEIFLETDRIATIQNYNLFPIDTQKKIKKITRENSVEIYQPTFYEFLETVNFDQISARGGIILGLVREYHKYFAQKVPPEMAQELHAGMDEEKAISEFLKFIINENEKKIDDRIPAEIIKIDKIWKIFTKKFKYGLGLYYLFQKFPNLINQDQIILKGIMRNPEFFDNFAIYCERKNKKIEIKFVSAFLQSMEKSKKFTFNLNFKKIVENLNCPQSKKKYFLKKFHSLNLQKNKIINLASEKELEEKGMNAFSPADRKIIWEYFETSPEKIFTNFYILLISHKKPAQKIVAVAKKRPQLFFEYFRVFMKISKKFGPPTEEIFATMVKNFTDENAEKILTVTLNYYHKFDESKIKKLAEIENSWKFVQKTISFFKKSHLLQFFDKTIFFLKNLPPNSKIFSYPQTKNILQTSVQVNILSESDVEFFYKKFGIIIPNSIFGCKKKIEESLSNKNYYYFFHDFGKEFRGKKFSEILIIYFQENNIDPQKFFENLNQTEFIKKNRDLFKKEKMTELLMHDFSINFFIENFLKHLKKEKITKNDAEYYAKNFQSPEIFLRILNAENSGVEKKKVEEILIFIFANSSTMQLMQEKNPKWEKITERIIFIQKRTQNSELKTLMENFLKEIKYWIPKESFSNYARSFPKNLSIAQILKMPKNAESAHILQQNILIKIQNGNFGFIFDNSSQQIYGKNIFEYSKMIALQSGISEQQFHKNFENYYRSIKIRYFDFSNSEIFPPKIILQILEETIKNSSKYLIWERCEEIFLLQKKIGHTLPEKTQIILAEKIYSVDNDFGSICQHFSFQSETETANFLLIYLVATKKYLIKTRVVSIFSTADFASQKIFFQKTKNNESLKIIFSHLESLKSNSKTKRNKEFYQNKISNFYEIIKKNNNEKFNKNPNFESAVLYISAAIKNKESVPIETKKAQKMADFVLQNIPENNFCSSKVIALATISVRQKYYKKLNPRYFFSIWHNIFKIEKKISGWNEKTKNIFFEKIQKNYEQKIWSIISRPEILVEIHDPQKRNLWPIISAFDLKLISGKYFLENTAMLKKIAGPKNFEFLEKKFKWKKVIYDEFIKNRKITEIIKNFKILNEKISDPKIIEMGKNLFFDAISKNYKNNRMGTFSQIKILLEIHEPPKRDLWPTISDCLFASGATIFNHLPKIEKMTGDKKKLWKAIENCIKKNPSAAKTAINRHVTGAKKLGKYFEEIEFFYENYELILNPEQGLVRNNPRSHTGSLKTTPEMKYFRHIKKEWVEPFLKKLPQKFLRTGFVQQQILEKRISESKLAKNIKNKKRAKSFSKKTAAKISATGKFSTENFQQKKFASKYEQILKMKQLVSFYIYYNKMTFHSLEFDHEKKYDEYDPRALNKRNVGEICEKICETINNNLKTEFFGENRIAFLSSEYTKDGKKSRNFSSGIAAQGAEVKNLNSNFASNVEKPATFMFNYFNRTIYDNYFHRIKIRLAKRYEILKKKYGEENLKNLPLSKKDIIFYEDCFSSSALKSIYNNIPKKHQELITFFASSMPQQYSMRIATSSTDNSGNKKYGNGFTFIKLLHLHEWTDYANGKTKNKPGASNLQTMWDARDEYFFGKDFHPLNEQIRAHWETIGHHQYGNIAMPEKFQNFS